MGTWGTDNFQNDGALDYVGDLVDELSTRIEEVLASEARARADGEGETTLVPSVAIITLLCDACNAAPPKPTRITDWRTRYLAVFDRTMPALDFRGDFTAPRRAVVEETFDKLLAYSRDFYKDDAGD
jgi:hypothetical protein